MSRPPVEPLAADIEALLRQERELSPPSPEFRARVMSRARTAWVKRARSQPWWASLFSPPALRRVGVAFAFALITTASYALYQRGGSAPTEPSAGQGSPRANLPVVPSLPATVPPSAFAAPVSEAEPPASPPPPSKHQRAPSRVDVNVDRDHVDREDAALELGLLQRARAAVAEGHFTAALTALGDHARRFPKSRFREEREALRIRALDGAGERQQADRASDSFREQFPRSVLQPREEKGRATRP